MPTVTYATTNYAPIDDPDTVADLLVLVSHGAHRVQFPEWLCGWLVTTARRECLHLPRQVDLIDVAPETERYCREVAMVITRRTKAKTVTGSGPSRCIHRPSQILESTRRDDQRGESAALPREALAAGDASLAISMRVADCTNIYCPINGYPEECRVAFVDSLSASWATVHYRPGADEYQVHQAG